MTNKSMTALVKLEDWPIRKIEPAALAEMIAENVGASGLTLSDLEQVTIPAGGGTMWTIPDAIAGPTGAAELTGVVLYAQDRRAFWREGLEDSGGGTPPDCSSPDAITGTGDPGGACGKCPMAEFGSAPDGRGQACKQQKMVFILREGSLLPLMLRVPATSLAPVRKYMLGLAATMRPYYEVLTTFKLAEAKSSGGMTYSRIDASVAGLLDPDAIASIKALRDNFALDRVSRPVAQPTAPDTEDLEALSDDD